MLIISVSLVISFLIFMEQNSYGSTATMAAHPSNGGLLNRAHWSLRMILGVLWVGLGLVALSMPVITTLSTALFFGWLLLIAGIAQVVVTVFNWKKAGMMGFLGGILFILFGMMLINNLFVSAVAITTLMGIFFLMQGTLSLVAAFYEDKQFMLPLLVVGIFSVIFGILILGNLVVASAGLIGLMLGWLFVLDGFGMIASASFADTDPNSAQKILGIIVFIFVGFFVLSRLMGWNDAANKPMPIDESNEMTLEVAE